jgi:hypothetical protein
LAYEAALLAGHTMDEETELLAKESLIPLSSCIQFTALDDEDNACKCDFCINESLYGEYNSEAGLHAKDVNGGSFFDFFMMMKSISLDDSDVFCQKI